MKIAYKSLRVARSEEPEKKLISFRGIRVP